MANSLLILKNNEKFKSLKLYRDYRETISSFSRKSLRLKMYWISIPDGRGSFVHFKITLPLPRIITLNFFASLKFYTFMYSISCGCLALYFCIQNSWNYSLDGLVYTCSQKRHRFDASCGFHLPDASCQQSCIKPVDFIKLHQICEHQSCCNLILADLLQVDKNNLHASVHAVRNMQQVS